MFLLALPFLPLGWLTGRLREDSAYVGPAEWALGIAIFGGSAWLLAFLLPGGALDRLRRAAGALVGARGRRAPVALFAALAIALCLVSTIAFEHRPQLVDGVTQLFQAKIFASGAVAAPAPPAEAFFITPQMIIHDGRWFSQYPPGHSALLAIGILAGAPWLVPIVLSLVTAAFLWRFAARAYDEATARLTLVLLVLTPFFWFMGASFMNHVSSLAGVAAFLYGFARWEEEGRIGVLAAAGAALGLAFLSRPVDALAIGAVFGGALAAAGWRERRWRPLVACGAGFLAVAVLYLAYNAATTGDPLRPGYVELWGAGHGLGFHESPWGESFRPVDGLRNELFDLSLLSVFLFEWPIPALLPLAVALAAGWLTRRWDGRLLAAFLAVPAIYFFYWHRDTFLGPRFLHVTLAFVIPLTARALVETASRLRGRSLRLPGTRSVSIAAWGLISLLLAEGYALSFGIPARFVVHASSREIMEPRLEAELRRAGVERGLVFVAESWGSRVIAQLRGLGARAAFVERAYRQSDLCDLDTIVRRARAQRWPARRLEAALDSVRVGEAALVPVDVGGGTTTRFRPGSRLSAECLDEIQYDSAGYAAFTPLLPLDSPRLDGPLVVARDLRGLNGELERRYGDRPAWIYRGRILEPLGERD